MPLAMGLAESPDKNAEAKWVPIIICDVCQARVDTHHDGNFSWAPARPELGILFAHKKCQPSLDQIHDRVDDALYAEELEYLPIWLAHFLRIDPAKLRMLADDIESGPRKEFQLAASEAARRAVLKYQADPRFVSIETERAEEDRAFEEWAASSGVDTSKDNLAVRASTMFDFMHSSPIETTPAGEPITWEMLVRHEPRLSLVDEITDAFVSEYEKRRVLADSVTNVFYGGGQYGGFGLKPIIKALVGFESRHPIDELHSTQAYDLVYQRALNRLVSIEAPEELEDEM